MLAMSSQCEIVEALRERVHRLEIARRPAVPAFSSGCGALDRALPGQGLHRGTLIEYLAEIGSGAVALALIAAREACREGGALVVMDRGRSFHPPAAANLGIDLTDVVFVHPRTRKDFLWALNQSLSCQGVGAVVGWPDKLDNKAFRQLQLAAEGCGTTGLLLRPPSVRGHPAWSELQLLVEALPAATLPTAAANRRLRVEVVRCRNGKAGASVELELDDETGTLQESHAMCVAPAMAVAAGANPSSGA
jgi:protein ImuA